MGTRMIFHKSNNNMEQTMEASASSARNTKCDNDEKGNSKRLQEDLLLIKRTSSKEYRDKLLADFEEKLTNQMEGIKKCMRQYEDIRYSSKGNDTTEKESSEQLDSSNTNTTEEKTCLLSSAFSLMNFSTAKSVSVSACRISSVQSLVDDMELKSRCFPSAPYSTGTLHYPHGTSPPPDADTCNPMTTAVQKSLQKTQGDDGDNLPSAPPLEVLDTVAGYEILSFDSVSVPPPEPYGDFDMLDPGQKILGTWAPSPEYSLRTTIPHMTESVARTALMGYVKNHCCWGVGAARHMSVTGIRHTCAYHYVLQTLTEKREARWAWSPHVGGDVDGPENGPAPSPWDIPAFPSKPFHTELKAIEVPHTASVKPCHRCRGSGTLACPDCHGKGWTRCLNCQGEGWGLGSESRERCIVCGSSSHGHGRQDCSRCGAKGRVPCSVCDSYGQLKCYIQLTVSWKVTIGEHVTGAEEMPPDLLRSAEGQIGIEETGIRLSPLPVDIISDETLAMASVQLINEHILNSSETLLLAQRHQVRVVPVTIIDYRWKNYSGNYFIYGLDNKVFAPDYPQTCCCGCVIL